MTHYSFKDLDSFGTEPILGEDVFWPEHGTPDPVVQGQYEETCSKCQGSGEFRGYSGRTVGHCFACNGEGVKRFHTSREQRETAAQSRAQNRARKVTDFSDWLDERPAVKQWLNENGPRSKFAADLIKKGARYGSLTEGQERAVLNNVAKEEARAEQRENPTPDASVKLDGIKRAFDTAVSNGLKRPALRINELVITRAPDSGRNPGFLYFKIAGSYVGKADPEGNFFGFKIDPHQLDVIKSISGDVFAKAVEHGRNTGNCACCGRTLTNSESIELGIGPICRAKWGL